MKDEGVQTIHKLKAYYYLTKPGIIYGNALYAAAGFLLASKGHINFTVFAAMLVGVSLIIGSSCVINNYIDRDIDVRMERTKQRGFATRRIAPLPGLMYGIFLGLVGFGLLIRYTNTLTIWSGIIGVFFYLVVYSWGKRNSIHGTLLGAVSGAMPPLAGYLAVSNKIDTAVILLFLILVFWQMAHFYAIAIRRLKDYKKAGLAVMPAVKGVKSTKIQIVFYIVAFTVVCLLLTVFGYTGYIYASIMLLLGGWWLKLSLDGFTSKNNVAWAKSVFLFSLVITLVFAIIVAPGKLLP